MKSRFFVLFICLLATVAIVGCDFFGSDDNDVTTTSGIIQGYVKSAAGAALAGVSVVTNIDSKTTNAEGYYEISAPVPTAKVVAEKAGYIDSAIFVNVSGTVNANITMRPDTFMTTVTLTSADTEAKTATNARVDVHNATIDFPAGSVVDADGNAVATVKVEIANSVPSDDGYADAFPGYFLGSTDGAAAEPIESFGYLDVNLYAADGVTPLKLGTGKTATIRIPANPDPVGVNTIPLWRLNETTGIWEQKGNATRVGVTNFFEATVDTFSSYNLDKPLTDTIPLTVTVYDGTPVGHHFEEETPANSTPLTPVVGAAVTVDIDGDRTGLTTGSTWQGRGVTNANGQVKFDAVPAGYLNVNASKGTLNYNGWGYSVSNGSASVTLYKEGAID